MADIEKARREINECDREMARLFEKRMAAVYEVARYKQERGLPVEDLAREGEVIAKKQRVYRKRRTPRVLCELFADRHGYLQKLSAQTD